MNHIYICFNRAQISSQKAQRPSSSSPPSSLSIPKADLWTSKLGVKAYALTTKWPLGIIRETFAPLLWRRAPKESASKVEWWILIKRLVFFLIGTLDLIGMWFGEDQRANMHHTIISCLSTHPAVQVCIPVKCAIFFDRIRIHILLFDTCHAEPFAVNAWLFYAWNSI